MIPESLLTGDNAAFVDLQFRAWREDPSSVEEQWRNLFEELPPGETQDPLEGPSFASRSIYNPPPAFAHPAAAGSLGEKVRALINAYRVRAHLAAKIDPLDRREPFTHPELDLSYYGLSKDDLDLEVSTTPCYGLPPITRLRKVVEHLQRTYCDAIGAEFMNIMDNEQKYWLLERLETLPNREVLTNAEERRIYKKMCDAENFERMLHTRFPATKRFSLEGGETLIPLLDLVVKDAGAAGIRELVIGMAHRGRLNTLVNILEKPAKVIVDEFQNSAGETQGSGDVKYHLGYSADIHTAQDHVMHVSLTPNPSHLELVNSVVQGRVRAKQDRSGDVERVGAMALLIHGDAAFSGQGSVMELLNLSELDGYRTGGTIHIVVNNQIGFTTAPHEGRSTEYCSDVGRMLAIPILHVNGESPRAVAAVVHLAVAYRMKFHRDVIIDMYCYRKHGHNEGDEPSYTQPLMYKQIRSRPTPRAVYAEHLQTIGSLQSEELDEIYTKSFASIQFAADGIDVTPKAKLTPSQPKATDPDQGLYPSAPVATNVAVDVGFSPLKRLWDRYQGGSIHDETDTTVPLEQLVALLSKVNTIPSSVNAHAKVKRLMKQRMAMIAGTRPIDWAVAEQAAMATLLDAGFDVRISGQDSGRGTFSHRHAVITDVTTGEEFYPLKDVGPCRFEAIDSCLSELAVLGFEIGHSFDSPDSLDVWEAQFGDFANGAQMMIDQYLTCSEQKWGRHCGLVLLLPHGYEGQGPEHSSARLERYLTACAQDNIQVANVTMPANFFHLLRRQMLRRVRSPLIIMAPKSGLRHPMATSTLDELANGAFQRVIDDPNITERELVKRVVLCSGKIYFELVKNRTLTSEIALVRTELLYPFPAASIRAVLSRYPSDVELVWCQEEPQNMGAWPRFLHDFYREFPTNMPRYIGREAAASPATGSTKKHNAEQQALVSAALTL